MKAALGGDMFTSALATEMGTGQFEIAAAQLVLGGIIYGMKKMVQNTKTRHEERRSKKDRDAQAAAQIAETQRIDAELAEQKRIADSLAQQQREREEQQREIEEAKRYHEEQKQRQIGLNNQRIEENKADIQRTDRMVNNVVSNMDMQRQARISELALTDFSRPSASSGRLRGQDVDILSQSYVEHPGIERYFIDNAMLQNDDESETWRLISGDEINDPNYPDNSSGRFQRTDPPPPDGGGPNGGNGGFPGPNGNDPGNGGFDGQGYPIGSNYNYSSLNRNPYYDIIKVLADQIQQQKNDEKQSVENAYDDQKPLGSDPATWSPVNPNSNANPVDAPTDEMPGRNGGGIYNPDVMPIQQEKAKQAAYDNAHILQNEVLDVIANQGEAELTAENQTALMYKISQEIPQLQKQQVQFAQDDVFSSQIRRF